MGYIKLLKKLYDFLKNDLVDSVCLFVGNAIITICVIIFIIKLGSSFMQPLGKQNLHKLMVDQFIKSILSGELKPGQKLVSEIDLASDFQVSRNMLREAMKTLEVFGVIESRHGQGTFISEYAKQRIANIGFAQTLAKNHSLSSLLETRIVIEPGLAEFAAQRRTDEDIDMLQGSIGTTLNNYNSIDSDKPMFHLAVAKASKCETLEKYLESIFLQLLYSDYPLMQEKMIGKYLEREIDEHQQILERIVSGDSAGARQLMYLHLVARFNLISSLQSE